MVSLYGSKNATGDHRPVEKPQLLMAVLAVGVFFGMTVERLASQIRRQAWRERNRGRWKNNVPKYPDAADQLRIIMSADFTRQPLLNKSEARVFRALDRVVIACNPGWQVMAQVSLGEVLRCKDTDAYGCINSKRVDLLLIDQGSAAARDAVKKEALRPAGIGYHEVVSGYTTPSELRRLVEKLVDRPAADRQQQSAPAQKDTLHRSTSG
jgi:hypothetical protein